MLKNNHSEIFLSAGRQSFREYFQPSRIMLLIVKSLNTDRVNISTVCFVMHAAYKPTSIAFALEKRHFSYKLLKNQKKLVLAVPGRELAQQVLFCGTKSGRDVDKGRLPDLPLTAGSSVEFILAQMAMANIEAKVTARVDNGDHDVFVCRVCSYFVNPLAKGPNLLSVGKNHQGYEILAKSGIHRIGISSA